MATLKKIFLPDIGNFKEVDVIEILVSPGDRVTSEKGLLTLESDKAAMEVPSPEEGIIQMVHVKIGDKISQGALLFTFKLETQPATVDEIPVAPAAVSTKLIPLPAPESCELPPPAGALDPNVQTTTPAVYASPSIRRFARELGVTLQDVQGSGPKGRITQEDIRSHVKSTLAKPVPISNKKTESSLPEWPKVNFSAFGSVEIQPLSRIQKLSGPALHRNALSIPHITQFDEADITDLESFRKSAESTPPASWPVEEKPRLTLLAFLMKVVVAALRRYPQFNASLEAGGENLILKRYFHIGVAVDTPHGLVVPVIREVDQKGIWDLAKELAVVSEKARARKLLPSDLEGGCFTLSSLGGIGGSHFTPIIHAPEVAILGIGRATMKPVWEEEAFVPKLLLPLSLSYDHRVIDGAAGARFIVYLGKLLKDVRLLLV
ncbi:pyruvate dehydrogenase E2 component (dihydrolipoamide acetyltransferase) [Gammaproteobacteria bacterium]